jgi:hypothetical protein
MPSLKARSAATMTPGSGTPRHRAVRRTPWRASRDPFAGTRPLTDLALIVGGSPDAREAEEILRDLETCRAKRRRE